MLTTRNVSADPPYFPILARSSQGKFVIARLRDALRQSNPVLEIADTDLEQINRDLRSSISPKQSTYAYFKVVRKGEGYTDVSLEVPPQGEFWFKSWYRIQDGTIHPQRINRYGPFIPILALPLSLLGGVFGVFCFDALNRRSRAKPVADSEVS